MTESLGPRRSVECVRAVQNEKPALPVLQMWLMTGGYMPIAHVRNKTHFVLVTGWDDAAETTLYVNDPGFDQLTYDYADVADILLYTVLPVGAVPPGVFPSDTVLHSLSADLVIVHTHSAVACLCAAEVRRPNHRLVIRCTALDAVTA